MLVDSAYIKENIGKTIEVNDGHINNKLIISRLSSDGFVGELIRKDKWGGTEVHFYLPIILDEKIKHFTCV